MAAEFDRDLGVDVLIIGGGMQGLYLARALHKRYSVCVVSDPNGGSETLDSSGYFSAGYTGNDFNRIQPARRAAGYWRLWAESNGVPHDYAPTYVVLSPDEEAMRTRLWSDATLAAKPALALPQIFKRGALDGQPAYLVEHDVVMNPTDVVAKLREGIEDRIIWGEVVKFGVMSEQAIDFVEVQTEDDRIIPITPRYVVLAANVGNGALLQRLVAVFKDRAKRRDAVDVMRSCQAVRRQVTIVARGDLPLVAGSFDGLDITAHPFDGDRERVWIINPPIDDTETVLGPEEFRFDPKLDHGVVVSALERLFAIAPELDERAESLQWAAYVARRTQHPMMAVPDTSAVAQPAPARIETLNMEGFVTVWPSHLSYSMIVGDVVAERIEEALGDPGHADADSDSADGMQPADVSTPPSEPRVARWERAAFPWQDWATFAAQVEYKVP